ncbi:MAG: PIG-L family deacetylase [Anaerolineales bacterium]|nr:PIG-L family deacetylase [Anaerolineales bacterium]
MMRKLMAVFAHPDDEGVMSGTMAHYIEQGDEVMLVCTTRGEAGEISDPVLATPENLGEVRQKELEEAARIIGVQQLVFLDYRDSGMAGTPANDDPRCLLQAEPDRVIGDLVALIREFQPDVFVTFEPFGWYGHPDHVTTGQHATAAFYQAADPARFPERGAAFQASSLYQSVFLFTRFREIALAAKAAGYIEGEGFFSEEPRPEQVAIEQEITHQLDVRPYVDLKNQALAAHRTQFGEDDEFGKIPPEMMLEFNGYEQFVQVYPEPDGALRANWASSLFL